jgi:Aromatic-ring hydroxylase, C-terminal
MAGDADEFAAAAATRNVPLKVLSPSDDRLFARYEARFALIRPDQHVAWRGNKPPADITKLLDCLTGVRRLNGGSPTSP